VAEAHATLAKPVPVRQAHALLLCMRCNYDLAGLAANVPCPECGVLVARSLAARDESYPSLRRLPAWIGAVTTLLNAMTIGILTFAFGFTLLALLIGLPGRWIGLAILLGCWLAWHAGWWRLATHDPTTPAGAAPRANLALKAVTLVAVLAPVAALAITFLPGQAVTPLTVPLLLPAVMLPPLLQAALGATLLARVAPWIHPLKRRWVHPPTLFLKLTAIAAAVPLAVAAAIWLVPPFGTKIEFLFIPALLVVATAVLAIAVVVQLIIVLVAAKRALRAAQRNAHLRAAIAEERTIPAP
jgi:hypothetical protein